MTETVSICYLLPVILDHRPIMGGLLRFENVHFKVPSVFRNWLALTELMSPDLTQQMPKAFWRFCFACGK